MKKDENKCLVVAKARNAGRERLRVNNIGIVFRVLGDCVLDEPVLVDPRIYVKTNATLYMRRTIGLFASTRSK